MRANYEVTIDFLATEEDKAEEKIRELQLQGYTLKNRNVEYRGYNYGNYQVEVTMEKNEQN